MKALIELEMVLKEKSKQLKNEEITMDFYSGYNLAIEHVRNFIEDEQKNFEEYYLKDKLSDL